MCDKPVSIYTAMEYNAVKNDQRFLAVLSIIKAMYELDVQKAMDGAVQAMTTTEPKDFFKHVQTP